jgi:L-lactate dehydrogenase (cytochrome)
VKVREIAALVRIQPPILNGAKRRLSRCVTVSDLQAAARRRLPKAVIDFVESGADDELTVGWNTSAFDRLQLVPRVLRDVGTIDTTTTVLGQKLPLPIVLGPAGVVRFVHPAMGERAIAGAARTHGIPYVLPTMATTSIEDLSTVRGANLWFNLLIWRDRGLTKSMLERAKDHGFRALVVTVDVPISGSRPREVRAGVTMPPKLRPRTVADGALHPSWWMSFLAGEAFRYPNVNPNVARPQSPVERVDAHFDPSVTWSDIEWVRSIWDGPIAIKGILAAADARLAVNTGVDAIVVSNHGGRQVDHLPPSIEMLPPIADAVGDQVELMIDGGIRRGSDIVKAIALGARACFVARPYFYGLATAGQAGVEHMIAILSKELSRTMALIGVTSLAELDPSIIREARS